MPTTELKPVQISAGSADELRPKWRDNIGTLSGRLAASSGHEPFAEASSRAVSAIRRTAPEWIFQLLRAAAVLTEVSWRQLLLLSRFQ